MEGEFRVDFIPVRLGQVGFEGFDKVIVCEHDEILWSALHVIRHTCLYKLCVPVRSAAHHGKMSIFLNMWIVHTEACAYPA